jgi:hypothetical protein
MFGCEKLLVLLACQNISLMDINKAVYTYKFKSRFSCDAELNKLTKLFPSK